MCFLKVKLIQEIGKIYIVSRLYSSSIPALSRGKPEERFRQRKEPFVARQREISAIICALIAMQCTLLYDFIKYAVLVLCL